MKYFIKAFCIVLAFVLVFSAVGCKGDDSISSIISSSSPSSSSGSSSSDNNSSSNVESSSQQSPSFVPDDSTDAAKPVLPEEDASNYVETNQPQNWTGPEGYVIVVPEHDSEALASAKVLKEFYEDKYGVSLSIFTDSAAAVEKEILVGKTNRKESNKTMPDSNIKVWVKGKKLAFDAAHYITLDMAVRKYIDLASTKKEPCTFEETTNFSSTKLDGYKYVWGDEFNGKVLDKNKWSAENTKMNGRNILTVENTSKTIGIKDGALRLTAFKDDNGVYHVPNSVHTQETMNYLYGYVEIRAKIPLNVGCFASFWTRSVSDSTKSVVKGTLNHYAEIDMFEVFQNKAKQQCVGGNILKNFPGNSAYNWYATSMGLTQQVTLTDYEYHVYGYEWSPSEINLYFDGKKYARFNMTKSWTAENLKDNKTGGMGLDGWNVTARLDVSGTGMECFNEAQYLIFNHHLHHKDGFTASTSVTENKNFKSEDYLIDYVRLYQYADQRFYTKK